MSPRRCECGEPLSTGIEADTGECRACARRRWRCENARKAALSGRERHLLCKICSTLFTTRHARKLTCSPECSRENRRRNRLVWYSAHRETVRAEAEAKRLQDPQYVAEIARHQSQLRRIWREHGLPVEELEGLSFYRGGFTTEQAAAIISR